MTYAIVVADAHLDGFNEEFEQFLSFLHSLQENPPHVFYILGDLFTIWLGTPKMQLPHQRRVIEILHMLRDKGVLVKYVEGNRDYFLSPLFLEAPFVEIASESTAEIIGNKRIYFSHGDLVNVHDKQYRLWRRVSRNRLLYGGFKCLPRSVAVRFVHALEQRFRGTNQKNKSYFPVETCKTYARNLLQTAYDAVILGHFHEEHRLEFAIHGQKKYLYALPAWKDTHKYLEINDRGECSFKRYVSRFM